MSVSRLQENMVVLHSAVLRNSLVLSASLAVIGAAAARAQDAQSGKNATPKVEEVIVTSQHRRERLQKVPVAVTALTSSSIAQRGIQQTQDLGASVPSLTVQQLTAGPATVEISLRGSVEPAGGLITSESPVAIYIDDVYQARLSAANMDLGDIDRIEVLRGPQGTLYGRNSMTGAIQFVTRQPTGAKWFDASLGTGIDNEVRGNFTSGFSVSRHLAATLSGAFDTKDGWQYDTSLKTHVGGNSDVALRGALGLVDSGPFTAVLHASYVYAFGQGVYFTPVDAVTDQPLVPGFGDTAAPQKDYASSRTEAISLNLGYQLGAIALKSITGYQYLTDDWQLDFSGGFKLTPQSTPETGFLRTSDANEHQISQEFRANGDAFGGRLKYIAGLFYFTETANQAINDTVGAGVFGNPVAFNILPTNYTTTSSSYAAYGQADYLLTRKLTLTAGLRFSDDEKNFHGRIQDGLTSYPATVVSVVPTQISSTVVTPKFTATYQFTDDLLSYATIARGYRAGGFNGLAVGDPTVLGRPYAPEKAWSYELGTKMQFFRHRLTFNAAGYYESLSNLQETAAVSDGSFATQNAAKAHVEGLEFEAAALPFEGVNIYGNLTLTDDGYDQLGASTEAAQAGATQLPLIAHLQAQFGGSWQFVAPFMARYPLTLAADYSFRSPHYSDPTNAVVGFTTSSNRLNASLTIQTPDKHWSLTASGRNISDEKYYLSGLAFIPGLIASKLPAQDDQWMLTARYHY